MKMPDPIIEPATIVVESSSPNPRTNPVLSSTTATLASLIYGFLQNLALKIVLSQQQEIDDRCDGQSCGNGQTRRSLPSDCSAFAAGSQRSLYDDRAQHER